MWIYWSEFFHRRARFSERVGGGTNILIGLKGGARAPCAPLTLPVHAYDYHNPYTRFIFILVDICFSSDWAYFFFPVVGADIFFYAADEADIFFLSIRAGIFFSVQMQAIIFFLANVRARIFFSK